MNYTAEHIDTEKFEAGLDSHKRYQEELQRTAIEKANARYEGYCKCLDDVRSMLHCSNYEDASKKLVSYREGANTAFDELCKELDVDSQDIQDIDTSVGEKAAHLASRIKENFQNKEMKNRIHDYASGANAVLSTIYGAFAIEHGEGDLCHDGDDPAEKAVFLASLIKNNLRNHD